MSSCNKSAIQRRGISLWQIQTIDSLIHWLNCLPFFNRPVLVNTPTKQYVGQAVCEFGGCGTMTHPLVCLISQQPDTGEPGEMERGQSCPQGTFKMPLWGFAGQHLLWAKLTKPERNTCCLGERGLIQEMVPPPCSLRTPWQGRGYTLRALATRKNRGSEGHLGRMGHLAKTHPGRYGCDIIAAFTGRVVPRVACLTSTGADHWFLKPHKLGRSFTTSCWWIFVKKKLLLYTAEQRQLIKTSTNVFYLTECQLKYHQPHLLNIVAIMFQLL